jgi:hypothetical protein
VRNRGFARFVKMQKGSVRIDEQAVEQDAPFDGKFVLTTNTELYAEEVATTYKGLWCVERNMISPQMASLAHYGSIVAT